MNKTWILPTLTALAFSAHSLIGQVYTVPEGYVTVTIAAGTGTTYTLTPFSAPLLTANGISGQANGRITAVGTNTITNSAAGWTDAALAAAGNPYFINFTSGANAGRMFQITANTATQLTVNPQGLDLTAQSFVVGGSGDTYEIVQGDTLLGLLGTPATTGVLGGTLAQFNSNTIDKIAVNEPISGVAFSYYFDTSASQWRRFGTSANQGNLVISPKSGLLYSRIAASPLTLTLLGKVPASTSVCQVPSAGTALMAQYFPTDTTLNGLNVQSIPSWKIANANGVTIASSDRVIVKNGTTLFSYYYDASSSQWRRFGTGADQGSVVIFAGSSVRLLRSGSAGVSHTWTRTLPYVLN